MDSLLKQGYITIYSPSQHNTYNIRIYISQFHPALALRSQNDIGGTLRRGEARESVERAKRSAQELLGAIVWVTRALFDRPKN
eukprot:1370947-Amorphochlora_amoeboformis.AAC.1